MAQEKILIRFDAKGDQKLLTAIKKLDVATKALTTSTSASTVATNSNTVATAANSVQLRNQGRVASTTALAFATLRSKMLLFTFAMSMGVKQLIDFSRQAAKIEGMSNAFNTLQGTTDGATIALSRLRDATNGTMNDMDLFRQANNAMVLGITKNSEEMARMFDLAQRLGRALGVDTAHAVESLVTGIGRQSRLMLDNIGIVVKSEEAYEKYAMSLGKTTSQLTDAEKKQAFLNATLEAAESKVLEMGEEVLTASDAYSRFGSNVMNIMRSIGDAINVVLVPAMNTLSDTMEGGFDFDTVHSTTNVAKLQKGIEHLEREIVTLIGHDGSFEFGLTDRAQARLNTYRIQLEMLSARMSELGVSTELTEETSTEIGQSFEDQFVGLELLNEAYKRSIDGQIALKKEELALAEASALRNDMDIKEAAALVQLQAELDDLIKIKNQETEAERKLRIAKEKATKAQEDARIKLSDFIALQKEYKALGDGLIGIEEVRDALLIKQERVQEKIQKQEGDMLANMRELIRVRKALAALTEQENKQRERDSEKSKTEADRKKNEALSLLNLKLKEAESSIMLQEISRGQLEIDAELTANLAMQKEVQDAITKGIADEVELTILLNNLKLEAANLNLEKQDQEIKNQGLLNDLWRDGFGLVGDFAKAFGVEGKALAGIQATLAVVDAFFGAQSAWKAATLNVPMVTANPTYPSMVYQMTLAKGLAQATAIAAAGAKMEQGGLIGGRLHSQGGTMVEAESGEFIMSRRAVNAVGVESLNRINQGGGGSSVNVNVSGNVMTQDFVEGELADAIKKAARRGSDFGIG